MYLMTIRSRVMAILLSNLVILVAPAATAAETEIEAALQQLLGSADVSSYLTLKREQELVSGQYEVRPGDTLDSLIQRSFSGSGIRRDFLRQAFVAANPRAFRNGNPNWMLAGVSLRIPTQQDLLKVVFEDPAQFDRRTSQRDWIRYP